MTTRGDVLDATVRANRAALAEALGALHPGPGHPGTPARSSKAGEGATHPTGAADPTDPADRARAVLTALGLPVPPAARPDAADPLTALLRAAGLRTAVAARRRQEFGPVMASRAALFEQRGLIRPGEREEDLVVVRGVRER
ncbi:hypothetical protein [Streptomyces sp. CBMA156]|uniref:hypothetical protein n=1 Tax=Streptomyces sp. CBMA156 TaxID=1930280 RepID=UPI001661F084|nr:hypothetical protein [Streptomyces sp. CBMA156]